jgi:hypothetical protein
VVPRRHKREGRRCTATRLRAVDQRDQVIDVMVAARQGAKTVR